MQINTLSNIAPDLGIGPKGAKSERPCAQKSSQDQVSISSLATQMASDPSKRSQLQKAYEAGTYNVSPSQIANSIINRMIG
jgi:anti-sigma28 factor (negative regulator of flagellin synthesis)